MDRVHSFLDRAPVPAWTVYAFVWLALFALQTSLKWLDGTYPVGTFSPFHLVFSGSAVFVFASMHYLDRVAAKGLDAFGPALLVEDDERARLLYRLTTLPAGRVVALTFAGMAWAVFLRLTFVRPYLPTLELATSPAAMVVDAGLLILLWSVVFVLVYHTVHQLRTVSEIYRTHARIDLFQIRPLYAFSPLAGIWQRLRAEKQRLLDEHHLRAKGALARFHVDLEAGDMQHMDGLNNAAATLELEHARLARMPVWPWSAATLRGLLTAVFLPLLVWGSSSSFCGCSSGNARPRPPG